MDESRRGAAFTNLPLLLLMVTALELVLNRLGVPKLQPPAHAEPEWWIKVAGYVALFLYYFATALAAVLLIAILWSAIRSKHVLGSRWRWPIIAVGGIFALACAINLVMPPNQMASFALEAAFAACAVMLVAKQVHGVGDLGAKLGLVLLTVPLLIHFYGPAREILGPHDGMSLALPGRIQALGNWAMVISAMLLPYCFAPRPFVRAASRLAPLAITMVCGVVAAIVMRSSAQDGLELAYYGFGIDLRPAPPPSLVALYILAFCCVMWTVTSCLSSEAPSRRVIGVGIALVAVGGYAFKWPMQYLLDLVALALIAIHIGPVKVQERALAAAPAFAPPPIPLSTWEAYAQAVAQRLTELGFASPAVSMEQKASAYRTAVTTTIGELAVALHIEHGDGLPVRLLIECGTPPADTIAPAWTLSPLADHTAQRLGAHPAAPAIASGAAVTSTGDAAFDRRFRVATTAAVTTPPLDDGLRARAVASIDGWLALWPGQGLRYVVWPGRGAPLDHPLPITELAFRGQDAPAAVDRLVALVQLVTDIAQRGLRPGPG